MAYGAGEHGFVGSAVSPETVLAVLAVLLALAGARWPLAWLGAWERPLARLARRPRLAWAVVVLAPLLVRALLLPLYPVPQPRTHDEFAFLLGADTFAHGRLANPVHPMGVHFESMHILGRPTYSSAFPAAQSAMLALGQVVAGEPWVGVWLSAGVMSAALVWMLQGWLPPRWALLGALLAAARFGVASYWVNSYWGGSLAAAGGALVLGAVPRLLRAPSWRPSLAAGFGLALLANTRPIEGAWFGLLSAVALLAALHARGSLSLAVVARRIVPGVGLVLLLSGAAMGYYFWRVTGKPYLPPYLLYRTAETQAPHFIWQQPRAEPRYNNAQMSQFYLHLEMHDYQEVRAHPLASLGEKAASYWRFYLGPLLTLPLLAAPWLRRRRALLWMAAAFPLVPAVEVWHNAHYAAPATGLALLLVALALRQLRAWRARWVSGLALARAIPWACLALLVIQVAAGPAATGPQAGWRWPDRGGERRAAVLGRLLAEGGRHLVFVRYGPRHDAGDEWVYNGADPDSAAVVWARELDPSSNADLLRYYAGRRAWLVEPDEARPEPRPYTQADLRPMPFVALGAPGIPTLRDPGQVRAAVLHRAGARELPCDIWNYHFIVATGVAAPDPGRGCQGADRARAVPFDHWWAWMLGQR